MSVYFSFSVPSYVARAGRHSPRNLRERESRMTIRQLALHLRFVLLVVSTLLFSTISLAQGLDYPETRKDDQVDDYHGTKVADPYRWLEDDNSNETLAWVSAQHQVTRGYLERIPYRSQMKQRLQELYNYPKYGIPSRSGAYYLWSKNDGLQNQSVLYAQEGLEGTPRV